MLVNHRFPKDIGGHGSLESYGEGLWSLFCSSTVVNADAHDNAPCSTLSLTISEGRGDDKIGRYEAYEVGTLGRHHTKIDDIKTWR